MKKELICIACPKGCLLKITYKDKKIIKISGNKCQKGIPFGTEEITDPKRIVTTTIPVLNNKKHQRLPVKTKIAIPKDKAALLLKKLKKIKITKKVKINEVILGNVYGTDVIASRSIP